MLTGLVPATAAPKEERFWQWFQANEEFLYDFEADKEGIFDRLQDELVTVYNSGAFEFGPVLPDGRREFFLSAGGNVDDFPALEALYAAAPTLPRWIVVKFIPRREEEFVLTIDSQGTTLQTSQVRYLLHPADEMVDLSLFVEGAKGYHPDAVEYLVWLTLQTSLGEEDFALRLREYYILDEGDKDFSRSKAIAELPPEFDAYFSR